MKNGMLKIKDLKGAIPHFSKAGNTKIGEGVWSWSTMQGNDSNVRVINAYNGKCSGTCGNLCTGCITSCYVNKSYRYPSVLKGHTINTVWMKENVNETFKYLSKQLKRAKKKPKLVRINQSGEIMSKAELQGWINLAKENENTNFYLYTKNYKVVKSLAEEISKLDKSNLTILISIWHDQGIKEYKELSNYNFIKAFVYDDKYNYAKSGINMQTYCKAYDEKGKMNHDITCNKCRKCFNRLDTHKVIGCYDH